MSGSQRRRLAVQINLGLTSVDAESVDAACAAAGVSRAAFARRQVLAAVRVPDVTSAHAYRPSGITALPPADVAAISGLRADVSRLTGSAIQLAKSLRQIGDDALHRQAEAVIADLRQQTDALIDFASRLDAERRN